ncbi:alpha/beta hydrolase, partial ['Melaleuca sp.' phytoplasma]|nr:alpha/beta hydrolase ['Melaleuca sp.' phytoplasma]
MFKKSNSLVNISIFLYLVIMLFIFSIENKQVYAHPLLNKEETGLYTDFKEVTLNNAKANVIVTHGIGESSR